MGDYNYINLSTQSDLGWYRRAFIAQYACLKLAADREIRFFLLIDHGRARLRQGKHPIIGREEEQEPLIDPHCKSPRHNE